MGGETSEGTFLRETKQFCFILFRFNSYKQGTRGFGKKEPVESKGSKMREKDTNSKVLEKMSIPFQL